MDTTTQEFIGGKRFAIVGVSRTGKKFGNVIYQELKEHGCEVFAVHPEAQEINGEPCYPNLGSLPGAVDGVIICVQPHQAAQAVREAAEAGISRVWLQRGAESPEALALAGSLGITPVVGKCILMYVQPVRSFHAWHRGFARLFNRL